VEKTRPAGPQRLDWREAPCAKAVTPDLVRRVQQALNDRGHPVGKADGVWGARTREALEAFQRAKGLPSGALTVETLRALDVQG
jgi:peptidoglycan hydrolase-like protein with peptidoglycan-binding domain